MGEHHTEGSIPQCNNNNNNNNNNNKCSSFMLPNSTAASQVSFPESNPTMHCECRLSEKYNIRLGKYQELNSFNSENYR